MEKQWKNETVGGTSCRVPVRKIRESENYGKHLLQGEILFNLRWETGIWYRDGSYAGTLVCTNDRSLDLVEVL